MSRKTQIVALINPHVDRLTSKPKGTLYMKENIQTKKFETTAADMKINVDENKWTNRSFRWIQHRQ